MAFHAIRNECGLQCNNDKNRQAGMVKARKASQVHKAERQEDIRCDEYSHKKCLTLNKAKADNHIGGGQSSYRRFITSIRG
jgi:hypothetical protein